MSHLITAEYQGIPFTFQNDGWFNATQVAERHKERNPGRPERKPAAWQRMPETKRYIAALCDRYKVRKSHFVKTIRGGNNRIPGSSGTWLHPKLAIRFAQWIDVDFAVWCDEQIDAIVRGAERDAVPDSNELSTVGDRENLYVAVARMVCRRRLRFDKAYGAINDAAGSKHFREMTKGQVQRAEPVALRIANGEATSADWALIESAQVANAPRQPQLNFSPGSNA